MPRVKGGTVTRKRRKKILKLAKGYFGSRGTLYKTANEQVMKSMAFAYRGRKERKRDFRKLWISRINAAAVANGMKYSRFINGLALANIEVNRKILADLAVNNPKAFTAYVHIAKKALDSKPAAEKVAVFDINAAVKQAKENRLNPAVKPVEPKVVKAEKVVAEPKAEKAPKVAKVVEPVVADLPVVEPVLEPVVATPVVEVSAPKSVKHERIHLEKLTVAELKELAVKAEIAGISKLKKAELIDALLAEIGE